jgi:hypothetical protein
MIGYFHARRLFMNISEFNLANSSLTVQSSGCTIDVSSDFKLPDGKSISQLLNELENNDQKEQNE